MFVWKWIFCLSSTVDFPRVFIFKQRTAGAKGFRPFGPCIQIRWHKQTDLNSHTLSTWILKDEGQEHRQRHRFPPSHASYLQLRKLHLGPRQSGSRMGWVPSQRERCDERWLGLDETETETENRERAWLTRDSGARKFSRISHLVF